MALEEPEKRIACDDGEMVGKMTIRCVECGDFVRAGLSRVMATVSPNLACTISTAALRVPVWHMMVSKLKYDLEDVKAIEDALDKVFATEEYRSVAYSRRKLVNILLTGIDVEPTTSIFYSGLLTKSIFYGGCPKIVMLLDSAKLKPTVINLGKTPNLEDVMNLSETYPYAKTDRDGNYWLSCNGVEQTRFGPEEQAYAHWIPGNAREALQGILILDDGLTECDNDDAFNAHLYNLLNFDE